jgi:hypothetical protein
LIEWQKTKAINSYEAYDEFLRRYPQSRFAEEAKEEVEWAKAQSKNNTEAYRNVLSAYPGGKYAEKARNEVEIQDWKDAKNLNTIESYKLYLDRHPAGRFIGEAEKTIQLKKKIAHCKPVSSIMTKQIEREISEFVSGKSNESLITDLVDFKFSVIGLSDQGREVDLTNYAATGEKGEISSEYFVLKNGLKPGKPIEHYRDGAWYPANKVVKYLKVIMSGSTIILRDGRTYTHMDGQWYACPGK